MYTIYKNKIENTWPIIRRFVATLGINAAIEKIFSVANMCYG